MNEGLLIPDDLFDEVAQPQTGGLPELPAVPGIPAPGPKNGELPYYEQLAREVMVPDKMGDMHPEVPDVREARRLSERLPPGYKPTTAAELTFDPRIAYEVALGIDQPERVIAKYGYGEDETQALMLNPAFALTVAKYKEEVTASGISFKLKAKIQAEDLLSHSYLIATDPEAPMAVRADLIKWTTRVAGLEPKEDKGGGQTGGFTLNISFAGDRPTERVIEGEVL
jgi:hypothetical protein